MNSPFSAYPALHFLFFGNVLSIYVVHDGSEGSNIVGRGFHAGIDSVQK